MSMIGIGLGGFMDGFQRGQQIRQDRERQKYLDTQQDRQKKLDARQDVLNARDDEEYARAETERQEIANIGTKAKTDYDARVAAVGPGKAGDFDSFWSKYALPSLKQTYLKNGNVEMANKVQEWGDSADAKRGGKLAMGALLKAQTGDIDGAINDVMEAGRTRGYIDHGFEVIGHETLAAPDGSIAGYRLKLKGPDGKDVDQDIAPADVPKLIATFMNPEAAWQSQVSAREAAAKSADDLSTYEAKKKIDKQYGTGENKTRGDAISSLRKRYPAHDETTAEDAPPAFDDLGRTEQERLIKEEIDLQQGQPGVDGASEPPAAGGASGRKVVVDTATGKPVSEAPARPAPQQTPPNQQPAPLSRDDNVSYLLQAADEAAKAGDNPERLAQNLRANGIPAEQWPESLATALALSQKNQVGLGGR